MPVETSTTWRRKKKKPEDETTTPEENRTSEKLLKLLPKILIGGVVAVYGYVLMDTARQVIVAQSTFDPNG